MPVLNLSLQLQLRETFASLTSPVTIVVFTRRDGDGLTREMCDDTRQLVEEVAALSGGKVSTEVYDLDHDADFATIYGIDKVPAIVVLGGPSGKRDFGIRFYGIPSGYEFGTLIEDIKMVSREVSDLSGATLHALSRLREPLHIQVYVTPTCPYCPRAVLLAHKLALASDLVTADMVDASEFPELADRHHVYGVPRTVINDTLYVEGAVPEAALVAQFSSLMGD